MFDIISPKEQLFERMIYYDYVYSMSISEQNYGQRVYRIQSLPAAHATGVEVMAGPHFNYKKLSNRALLEVIKEYIAAHGYSPTIRELAKITGSGVATVHNHLNQLIYGGYIKVEQPRRRVFRVMKDFD